MNVAMSCSCSSLPRQRGLALVMLVFLAGLAVTAYLVSALKSGSNAIAREKESTLQMNAAKAAVISQVVSDASTPGRFVCPEDPVSIGTVNEGQAANCSGNVLNVGRLAWRSLGLGEVKDGNSDHLWYVLGAGFRTSPINSDTPVPLAVDGVAQSAIAILFSPGHALDGQDRPPPSAPNGPAVAAYLDGENSDGDVDFITGPAGTTFNDRALLIRHQDVFPALEKRMLGEVRNALNEYKAIWGAFPFPAPFNPAATTYVGSPTVSGGLLPIDDPNTTPLRWSNVSSSNMTLTGSGVYTPPSCQLLSIYTPYYCPNCRLRCDVTVFSYDPLNPLTISMWGQLSNIGRGFYKGMDVSNTADIRITTRDGDITITPASRTLTHALDAAGNGYVTLSGVLSGAGMLRVEFRRVPSLADWVGAQRASNPVIQNNWHQLIFYKVAAPFLPGGNKICGSCLQVDSQANVHALVMSAGRRLDVTELRPSPTFGTGNPAQVRPSASLGDYFDSANNAANGNVYETRDPLTSIFNDQIVIVE